jgi:hypothetical protein
MTSSLLLYDGDELSVVWNMTMKRESDMDSHLCQNTFPDYDRTGPWIHGFQEHL